MEGQEDTGNDPSKSMHQRALSGTMADWQMTCLTVSSH